MYAAGDAIACLSCGYDTPDRIDAIRETYEFAGSDLADPLPGGALYRMVHAVIFSNASIVTPH